MQYYRVRDTYYQQPFRPHKKLLIIRKQTLQQINACNRSTLYFAVFLPGKSQLTFALLLPTLLPTLNLLYYCFFFFPGKRAEVERVKLGKKEKREGQKVRDENMG